MNETIRTQLQHRSIREFEDRPVDRETLDTLFDVAMATASSLHMQSATIIHVTDRDLQRRLAVVSNQEYVGRAPVYLLFVADCHRNAQILAEQGSDPAGASSVRNLLQAITDASLMAQNLCVAAESLGLGVCFLGSIHNDAEEIIRELQLPPLTLPVVGMILGYPGQEPQLKPRMDKSFRVMENTYTEPASWSEALAPYDEIMTTYYDLRMANQRSDSFTRQVVAKNPDLRDKRDTTLEIARRQGFEVPGE